jgi:hypothetical protein
MSSRTRMELDVFWWGNNIIGCHVDSEKYSALGSTVDKAIVICSFEHRCCSQKTIHHS